MKIEDFIKKALLIHGNKYDYSLVEELSIKSKYNIICPVHGSFLQRGDAHLNGQGCPICGGSKHKKTENFIIDANNKHNNYYDYSLTKYINSKTKITIICPVHGNFIQIPDNHLSGHGCPSCGINKLINSKTNSSIINFKEKAIRIHGDKYNYDFVKYIDAKTKIEINCPIHGKFKQTPNDHLSGKGCLFCSLIETKPEREIKIFFESLNINYIENDKNILNGLEIDIYLPDHKLGIEFDGLYWHSDKFKDKNYHLNKTELAKKNGIQLIHIFEDEWANKKDIVKSIIKSKLNIFENIINDYKIIEINDNQIIKKFLEKNHIFGYIKSDIKIGLFNDNELVSQIIFKKISEDKYEILRFCDKLNTNITNSINNLLNYFINYYNPKSISVSIDRRYNNSDNIYKQLGFKFVKNTKPNCFYFKKNNLIRNIEFEHQIDNNYLKIFDCGYLKYQIFIFS